MLAASFGSPEAGAIALERIAYSREERVLAEFLHRKAELLGPQINCSLQTWMADSLYAARRTANLKHDRTSYTYALLGQDILRGVDPFRRSLGCAATALHNKLAKN